MINFILKITSLTILIVLISCNNKEETKNDAHDEHNHKDTSSKAECCTTEEEITNSDLDNSNSLYEIDLEFTDMNSKTVKIEDFKGEYLITSMIFTQCEFACPTIVNNVKDIQNEIGKKANLKYLMVSFDHKRDKPSQLKSFYNKQELNSNWHLLTGSSSNIRIYSMIFNISYQELDNGDFSHSNAIFLVDKNGNIVDKFEGLKINTKEVSKKILDRISKNP